MGGYFMNIYIDESGSMTHNTKSKKYKYFIITLVLVEEPEKLKKVYRRFIKKHFDELKSIDKENKMFKGGKFVELKGSAFTPEMKNKFVDYFCKNNHFKIVYIRVDNSNTYENFYKNKARAFNYVLKLGLEHLNNEKILVDRSWTIQIDERNVKTDSRDQLEEHLNTEFSTGKNLVDKISVKYFDSSNNKLIQLADVFSNLLYSYILTDGAYENEIQYMIDNEYLIKIFEFPLNN